MVIARRAVTLLAILAACLCVIHAQETSTPEPSPEPSPEPPTAQVLFDPGCGNITTVGGQAIEMSLLTPTDSSRTECENDFISSNAGEGLIIKFLEVANHNLVFKIVECTVSNLDCVLTYSGRGTSEPKRTTHDRVKIIVEITGVMSPTSLVSVRAAPPPFCSLQSNHECAIKYAKLYGCMMNEIVLPVDDDCYQTITIDRCHLSEDYCHMCDVQCQNNSLPLTDPSWHNVTDLCRPSCGSYAAPDWKMTSYSSTCAPGCKLVAIGDGICDLACNNERCYSDGGDCAIDPSDPLISIHSVAIRRRLSTYSFWDVAKPFPVDVPYPFSFPIPIIADTDNDGQIHEDELSQLYSAAMSTYPVHEVDFNKDGVYDARDAMYAAVTSSQMFGFSRATIDNFNVSASHEPWRPMAYYENYMNNMMRRTSTDPKDKANPSDQTATARRARRQTMMVPVMGPDGLDDVNILDQFAMGRGYLIVDLLDKNSDGEVSAEEGAIFTNGYVERAMVVRDAIPDWKFPKMTADAFAYLHLSVYTALSGRTLRDGGIDPKDATQAVMMLYDMDDDGKLDMKEALILGLSGSLVRALDHDMDGMVSAEELLDAQRDMMAARCAGETIVTDRDTVIDTKPPLSGMRPRNCSIVVLPDWFYPSEPSTPSIGSSGGSRRASAPSTSSRGMVMSRSKAHAPSRQDRARRQHKTQSYYEPSDGFAQLTPGGGITTDATGARRSSHPVEPQTNTNETMPWLVIVRNNEPDLMSPPGSGSGPYVMCTGALITMSTVLVSGSCASRIKNMSDVTVHFQDGRSFMVEQRMLMPRKEADNNATVALLTLSDFVDDVEPVQLHDGLGLGADSTCSEDTMMIVGYTKEDWRNFEGLEALSAKMVEDWKCMDTYARALRINPFTENHMCAMSMRFPCFFNDRFQSIGPGFLVAPHPEDKEKMVLVGVFSSAGFDACNHIWFPHQWGNPPMGVPMRMDYPPYPLFSKASSIINWLLSTDKDLGRFPPQLLSVETAKLALGQGAQLHVSSGDHLVTEITDKCEPGGTYFDELARGSMTVSIFSEPESGHQMADITLRIDSSDCGSTPPDAPGSSSNLESCTALSGCSFYPEKKICASPRCSFSLGWKEVTQELQANGMAFTGGLGGEAVVNGAVEYRQWMCARDWNVTEQVACNVGPGELACFRYNEKAGMTMTSPGQGALGWDFLGRNSEKHVKLVSPAKLRSSSMSSSSLSSLPYSSR